MNSDHLILLNQAAQIALMKRGVDGMRRLNRLIVCVAFIAVFAGSIPSLRGQTIYEAEDVTLSGPAVSTQYAGYSGTGYADYQNASGDYVEFSINASSAGTYPISFRYANGGSSDRPLQLSVNGTVAVGSLSFPSTGGWANWAFTATNNVTLNAGPNTVRITSIGSNGANVDYMLVAANGTSSQAANAVNAPLRRPISPNQPMWLVHIDSWNLADPQKIINMVPSDIRPYVVFNISLSINHNSANSQWLQCPDGYETAKSWLRICAENGVWAMIQPSSGGFSQLPDSDIKLFEEFYRDYPNFIGFNYAEQFWGFDSTTDPLSWPWFTRVAHWVDLMKLNQKYGGYLVVSWCGNQWDPNINPIAMMKRNPAFAAICQQSPKNFILEEKYTQQSYQSDMESVCLGSYLAGYAGQYGIRYDSTGWTDATGSNANFTLSTGGAPTLEHAMLTGETVMDGPETIPTQASHELSTGTTSDGYTTRRWDFYPQCYNVTMDLFRKILDGTVRIPSRQEVLNRTKVVVVDDVNSGSADNIYSSPMTLFEGLYRMDGDGDYQYNKYFFKKTGRYPTIPTVFNLADAVASNSFTLKVNNSAYATRWPSLTAKTNELNTLFPQEYTGDIYAGRYENGWVIYNPYKTGQPASGSIPFKYNTCDHVDLTLSQYTSGVMKEYSNSVSFYLNNYDNVLYTGLKTNVITIYGSTSEPAYTWSDRASHQASIVTKSWSGGVWTLTVLHNGAVDITVNCAGTGTGRLTSYTPATIAPLAKPLVYTGPHQYEAENFDYKSINGNVTQGVGTGVTNYMGMGYLKFGTLSAASIRDTVTVLKTGAYRLDTRYSVTGASVSTIDLYVNGVKTATPMFTQTAYYSDWAVNEQYINLNAGANTIEFRANGTGASSVYFDNIVIIPTVIAGGIVIQENQAGFQSVDGSIDNFYQGYTGAGYAAPLNSYGAGIDWSLTFDSSVTKSLTFRYAGTNDNTADLLVNGANVAANIQFPSTGALTNWESTTVYPSIAAGTADVRLQSSTNTGLPLVDYLEVAGGWSGTPPPTGLTAIGVAKNQINLSWSASSNATSYKVKRSLTNGGPYSLVASGIATTNFNDIGLAGGTTYYYVVSAVSPDLGESYDSAEASATTLSGTVTVAGYTSGTYTVASGSGVLAGTFDLNDNANVLVVGVYIDANSISCLTNLTSFGGVPPTGYIQTSGGGDREFALYWINPKTSAGQNLVIGANASANIGAGYFALQLSGVDTNAAVAKTGTTTTGANNVNITTTAANSFVLSFYSANDSGLTLTPSAPLTLAGLALTSINGTGGGGSLAMATNVLAAAGTENLAWSSSGTINQQGVNGLAFAPVALLAGPGGPELLTSCYNAGVLSLSWPAGEGWRLQIQTNSTSVGLGTNWVYVTDGTVSITNITVDPAGSAKFFRLRYP
jgi:hypothetical protein